MNKSCVLCNFDPLVIQLIKNLRVNLIFLFSFFKNDFKIRVFVKHSLRLKPKHFVKDILTDEILWWQYKYITRNTKFYYNDLLFSCLVFNYKTTQIMIVTWREVFHSWISYLRHYHWPLKQSTHTWWE